MLSPQGNKYINTTSPRKMHTCHFVHTSKPEPFSCVFRISVAPSNLPSVTVEQTLRNVQTSRSRLRFFVLWLEQVIPGVTDSNYPDDAEQYERHQPCLTLANSILTILREPLPSDKPSSSSRPTAANTSPRSRVSAVEAEYTQCSMRWNCMTS